jgi:hypothetical protein
MLLLVCRGLVLQLLQYRPEFFQGSRILGTELLRRAAQIGMLHGVEHRSGQR